MVVMVVVVMAPYHGPRQRCAVLATRAGTWSSSSKCCCCCSCGTAVAAASFAAAALLLRLQLLAQRLTGAQGGLLLVTTDWNAARFSTEPRPGPRPGQHGA